jgi:hypothetical protein
VADERHPQSEISHDQGEHRHHQPCPLHGRQESPHSRPAGKCSKEEKEGALFLVSMVRLVPVTAFADRPSGHCSRFRTGVRFVGCGTLLLYCAPKPWDQDFDFMILSCGGATETRTPDLLHAIGTLPGSLGAACLAESAAAADPAPAAACRGLKAQPAAGGLPP